MKYIYIVNRFNLKEKTGTVLQKLQKASEKLGRNYEIIVNETPEEADHCLSKFRETEYVITAIGGDGSVYHVLNGLVGTRNLLAFVPVGTGNDFYRNCTETMEDGIHTVDLVRINDRYFINVACFGIDADIANDDAVIHNSLIPRSLRYHAGVLSHFLTWRRGRRLRVECNGETIEQEFTTVIAANSKYYGGGYRVSPHSGLDDGVMELFLVNALGKIKMARTILSIKSGRHLLNPEVRHLQTRKAVISSDTPFRANLDGDPCLADRFELEVVPGGIRIELNRAFSEEVRV